MVRGEDGSDVVKKVNGTVLQFIPREGLDELTKKTDAEYIKNYEVEHGITPGTIKKENIVTLPADKKMTGHITVPKDGAAGAEGSESGLFTTYMFLIEDFEVPLIDIPAKKKSGNKKKKYKFMLILPASIIDNKTDEV